MRASRLAEAATLGALLVDPVAVRPVTGWLRAADFADPWHAEVYTAIRERDAAGEQVDAEQVANRLVDRLGLRRAQTARLVDLLHAAPIRPQPARYAAMVLESALRRELVEQGILLRAAALSATLQCAAAPVVTTAAVVDATIAASEARWDAATGTARARPAPPGGVGPVLRNLDRAVAADRFLAAHPPLDPHEARDRERRLVAALIRRPEQLGWVASWLHPDALTDKPWRAVYAAAIELADRGEPVDVVTVAWQVQHASRRLGAGPRLTSLTRAVEASIAEDPTYLGGLVAADLLRRIADAAARALTAATRNPGVDVRDLFETGRLLTGSLRGAAAGLSGHGADAAAAEATARTRQSASGTAPVLVPAVSR